MNRFAALAIAMLCATIPSQAQREGAVSGRAVPFEVTVAYSADHINAPPGGCGCFWMTGGKIEENATLYRGFSVVAELAGQHVSNINPVHEDLSMVSYLFGPRYSRRSGSRFTPFVQVLAGGVHGFDALFPNQNGSTITPDGFALAAGGGLNINASRHIAIRVFQVDYFLTKLPNDAGDRENNLRLSAGILFRIRHR